MMKRFPNAPRDDRQRNRITEKNKWNLDAPYESEASGDRNCQYSSKSSINDELPELVVFLHETDCEFVKDICIDKEVTSLEENCDTKNGHVPYFFKQITSDNGVESTEESEDLESSISSTESTQFPEKDCLNRVIQQQKFCSDATDELPYELPNKQIAYKIHTDREIAGKNKSSPARDIAISLCKLLDENSYTSKAAATSPIAPVRFFSDSSLSASTIGSSSRKACCRCSRECERTLSAKADDDALENQTIECRSLRGFFNQNDQREASSSTTDPISSSVAKSLSSSYSGNLSFRSNSSTNSSHSFAFPILQTEWNGSPQRMLKATPMHTRRQRLWRMCFPCFRF